MRSKNPSTPAPAPETPTADQTLPATEAASSWGALLGSAKNLAQKAAASRAGQGLIKTTKKLVKKKVTELTQSQTPADGKDASILASPLGTAIGAFIQQQVQDTPEEAFISEDDSDQAKKLTSAKNPTATIADDGSNNNAGNGSLLESVASSSVAKALMEQASSFVQQQAANLVTANSEIADNNLQESDEDEEEEEVSWEMVEVEVDDDDAQDSKTNVADLSALQATPLNDSKSNNNAANQLNDTAITPLAEAPKAEAPKAEASQDDGEKTSFLQTLTNLSQNDKVKSFVKSGASALKEFGPSAVAALSSSEPGQEANSGFLGKAAAFVSDATVQKFAESSFDTVRKVAPSVAAAVSEQQDAGNDNSSKIVAALSTIATNKDAQQLVADSFSAANKAVIASVELEEKTNKPSPKDSLLNKQAETKSKAAEEALWKVVIQAAAADPSLRKACIFAAESGISIWVVPKITNVVLRSVIGEAWAETISSTMSNWATYAAFFRLGRNYFPAAPDTQANVQPSAPADNSKKMN